MSSTACRLLAVKETKDVTEQLFLPTRDNIGFGLRKNDEFHLISYISSFVTAMSCDKTEILSSKGMSPDQCEYINNLLQQANRIFDRDKVLSFEKGKEKQVLRYPNTVSDLQVKIRDAKWVTDLHSLTCRAMTTATLQLIKERHRGNTHRLKLIDSLVMNGTSAWINGYPTSKRSIIYDDEYRNSARDRLGLPFRDEMPHKCSRRCLLVILFTTTTVLK